MTRVKKKYRCIVSVPSLTISSLILGVNANGFLAPNKAMSFRRAEDLFLDVSFVVDPHGEHAQGKNSNSLNVVHMNRVLYEVLCGDSVESRHPTRDSPVDVETESVVSNVHRL